MEYTLNLIITSPTFLGAWIVLVLFSVAVLIYDLRRSNAQIMELIKWVWVFTVVYSGPLGLAVYYYSGRRQIARDSLWRRAFRSVAHCYSGCGLGEIVGVVITVGLLGLGTWWVAGTTFALAYLAGFGLTVGPLVQEGVALRQALWDAFYNESASITVMDIVAIAVDIWLAGKATMGDVLFWSSLVVSLTAGLVAAYPVNVVLIQLGVKEGMHSSKEAHAAH